jgi:AbiEi antitoxin C-terminal domain/Protein of unknown function (DUF559)
VFAPAANQLRVYTAGSTTCSPSTVDRPRGSTNPKAGTVEQMEPPRIVIAGASHGLSRQHLRGAAWAKPFYGVRVESADVTELHVRCLALLAVAPVGSVISGLTAAKLYGWWLAPKADTNTIDITVPPEQEVRRPGVRCRRREVPASQTRLLLGVPVTSPARTLLDLAADLPLIDLVVLADAALHLGHCTIADLTAAASFRRRDGRTRFQRMLELMEPKSESPMETLLRLVYVLSGLPRPEAQVEIFGLFDELIARCDLAAVKARAVFEYDGQDHNSPQRHATDVRRWRALRKAGYEVFPYTAVDLFRKPHQIVNDYQRALGLTEDPHVVQGWLDEWRQSGWS